MEMKNPVTAMKRGGCASLQICVTSARSMRNTQYSASLTNQNKITMRATIDSKQLKQLPRSKSISTRMHFSQKSTVGFPKVRSSL